MRIFAGNNPEDVCGLVAIESSHPDMLTRFAEIGLDKQIPDKNIRPITWLLSNLGMPERSSSPDYIDPIAQAFTPKSSLAWFDETAEAPTSLMQASEYANFGDMPLILLASGYTPADITPERETYQNTWMELQNDLLSLSNDSEIRDFEDIPEAGHYIQLQTPELVIEAIQDVLEKCE
jgi:pimeloyl-ACP methyl ester carboxylesterase